MKTSESITHPGEVTIQQYGHGLTPKAVAGTNSASESLTELRCLGGQFVCVRAQSFVPPGALAEHFTATEYVGIQDFDFVRRNHSKPNEAQALGINIGQSRGVRWARNDIVKWWCWAKPLPRVVQVAHIRKMHA